MNRIKMRLVMMTATMLFGLSAQATHLYVDGSASGANDGSSWADAYQTLQAAIAGEADDATFWVAQGTYDPGATLTVSEQTFYGGFAGTETELDERDWEANPTIITGAETRGIISKTVAGVFTLDGFTLKDGKKTGTSTSNGGAAILCYPGSLVIRNSMFTNNVAQAYGGAIFVRGGALTNQFINVTFVDNELTASSQRGGAVQFYDASVDEFEDCRFIGNETGAGNSGGGAIYKNATSGLLKLTRCLFQNNVSKNTYNNDGGGAIFSRTQIIARDTDFIGNSTYLRRGGAVLAINAHDHEFINCAFVGNTLVDIDHAVGGGAGLALDYAGSTLLLENCTFYKNTAGGTATGEGAGVDAKSTTAITVRNSIFKDNTLPDGGTNPDISSGGSIHISYTLIDSSANAFTAGDGVFDDDPLFASTTEPYDVHLKSDAGRWDASQNTWVFDAVKSPAIDAGDPVSDFDLEPPDNGGRINLGRYGNTVKASRSRVVGTLIIIH